MYLPIARSAFFFFKKESNLSQTVRKRFIHIASRSRLSPQMAEPCKEQIRACVITVYKVTDRDVVQNRDKRMSNTRSYIPCLSCLATIDKKRCVAHLHQRLQEGLCLHLVHFLIDCCSVTKTWDVPLVLLIFLLLALLCTSYILTQGSWFLCLPPPPFESSL